MVIKQLLKKYHDEHNATVIISSHNLNHTVDICSRIALMEHGKIIRDLMNENNSAEQELENYFNAKVEEEVTTKEEATPTIEEPATVIEEEATASPIPAAENTSAPEAE